MIEFATERVLTLLAGFIAAASLGLATAAVALGVAWLSDRGRRP
ncbi:hypothetical protein [Amorphus orientalis]|uniref:Uncharacterized protein n=1 Tax=Amorphus orientalis TaxID=649198 RepID=A0AAE4ATA8_9HYPH|nr:hypothetical protein [Amorphus orientalis]MDQ0314819.1 hypothetical protein [Amorphus orientalis]